MGDDVASLKKEMPEKADRVGVYPDITSGTAEQLASTQYVEDTAIYKLRPTGGSADVGNREYLEKIVGGTVCWNQLVENGDFSNDTTGWSTVGMTISVANGVCTCTAESGVKQTARLSKKCDAETNHKYILSAAIRSNVAAKYQFYFGGTTFATDTVTPNEWSKVNALNNINNATSYLYLYCSRNEALQEGDTVDFKNICVFDLTAMFGPTIADYVYGLEQATAGAGVAWFRKYFPNDYYEYNPGEFVSVSGLHSHDMVGFNLFDKADSVWGSTINSSTGAFGGTEESSKRWRSNYIAVLPDTNYQITGFDARFNSFVYYYDINKKGLSRTSASTTSQRNITTPKGCCYVAFTNYATSSQTETFIDNRDGICMHLTKSGTRNGEYEPYEKHSYPLDSNVVLRGIPKLDANGNLYFDGDEYPPDGNVVRKRGIVNLGTLSWVKTNWFQASAVIPDASASANNDKRFFTNVDCTINSFAGSVSSTVPFLGVSDSGSIRFSFGGLYNDMTVEQFAEAMSNKYLVYPLAAQSTEQAEPYQEIQVCSDWGTEEFVSDSILPIGHLTRYPANLRDKLQHLPSLADADGDYIVRQTGSQMSLVGLGDTDEVAGIKNDISELRATASAQGIYVETESQPIVSISDGADNQPMKAVKVAIEPVQDLHGYDAPWPAGSRNNLFDEVWESGTINGTTGEEASNPAFSRSVNFIAVLSNTDYYVYGSAITSTSEVFVFSYQDDGTYISYQKLSSNGTYTTPSNCAKIRLQVRRTIETVTNYLYAVNYPNTVTTYSPCSNICPISGWTGVKVTRTGKNLWGGEAIKNAILTIKNASTGSDADGGYVSFSAANTDNDQLFTSFKSDTQYTVVIRYKKSNTSLSNNLRIAYTDGTKKNIVTADTYEEGKLYTAITTSQVGKTISHIEAYFSSGTALVYYDKCGLFEGVITEDQFVPYQGQTYEVTFPSEAGTVYGGTLDVVSGKLVIDRVSFEVTDSTYISRNNSFSWYIGRGRLPVPSLITGAENYDVICDKIPKANCFIHAIGHLRFNTTIGYDDASSMLAGNNGSLQFVYPIASPQEFTLSQTEIKTLLGLNNVFVDCGDTAITYPADTKLYIDKKIAELQALILENNG